MILFDLFLVFIVLPFALWLSIYLWAGVVGLIVKLFSKEKEVEEKLCVR